MWLRSSFYFASIQLIADKCEKQETATQKKFRPSNLLPFLAPAGAQGMLLSV